MKAVALIENLQKKIPFLNHAISSRSQLPIVLNFLIEAKTGKLIISATDLEIGIQTEIPASVEEEGGTTVPAKTFSELIMTLPGEKIDLNEKQNKLTVTTVKTKSVFQTIAQEDFPRLYEEKGHLVAEIPKETIQKDLKKVLFSASLDSGRPALSGVLVKNLKDEMVMVATDGYRLSLKQHSHKKGQEIKEPQMSLLIPARVLKEIVLMKETEGGVGLYVSKEKNQVLFNQDRTTVVGRLIDAEFPPYEKIIPSEANSFAAFDKEEMQKAVKICSVFARESANIVRFSLKKDKIVVSANTPSVGDNMVEVEAVLKGEENEIAFNARYLLDLLGNLDENEMVFEMTGPLNPGVFKVKGDDTFLHLIMPIRVQA